MPTSLIPGFLVYIYVSAITPGPANLASLAASLRYGRKVAMKQWRGIFIGFAIVSIISVFITWLMGVALIDYVGYFSWIGAAYILYLAWNILRSSGAPEAESKSMPTFRTGLIVQITNVKVMIMCLTALSVYVLPYDQSFLALLKLGIFLPFTGPIANLLWLIAGSSLQNVYTRYKRPIDIILALSLALCAISLLIS